MLHIHTVWENVNLKCIAILHIALPICILHLKCKFTAICFHNEHLLFVLKMLVGNTGAASLLVLGLGIYFPACSGAALLHVLLTVLLRV